MEYCNTYSVFRTWNDDRCYLDVLAAGKQADEQLNDMEGGKNE